MCTFDVTLKPHNEYFTQSKQYTNLIQQWGKHTVNNAGSVRGKHSSAVLRAVDLDFIEYSM